MSLLAMSGPEAYGEMLRHQERPVNLDRGRLRTEHTAARAPGRDDASLEAYVDGNGALEVAVGVDRQHLAGGDARAAQAIPLPEVLHRGAVLRGDGGQRVAAFDAIADPPPAADRVVGDHGLRVTRAGDTRGAGGGDRNDELRAPGQTSLGRELVGLRDVGAADAVAARDRGHGLAARDHVRAEPDALLGRDLVQALEQRLALAGRDVQ